MIIFMKKIIIFGATGNIGAYFVDYCNSRIDKSQYEIIAVGRKETDFFLKNGIKYINVDICKLDEFNKLPTNNIYAIVNLAGIVPAYVKEYDPYIYIDTNIKGAIAILEYARKNRADRVLYTQTWADLAGYWGHEEILNPSMPRKLLYQGDHAFYSITKSMIVDTMSYYKAEYGLKNFIFRLPNIYLYSPELYYYVDCQKKVIAYRHIINQAIKGEPIELWGNPNAFKDIIYVKDLCKMMYLALFANVDGGIYNAGTGIKTTLREQIEGIVKVFCTENKISKIIEKPHKSNFTSFVMDIENAKNDLNYIPEYDYLSYLEDYKEEMQSGRFNSLWGN